MNDHMVSEKSPHFSVDDVPFGLLVATLDGLILNANNTLLRWLGCESDQLLGTSLADLLSAGDRMFYETRLVMPLRLGVAVDEVVFSLKCANNELLPVVVTADVHTTATGEQRVRAAVFDRTRWVKYERALVDARRSAFAAEEQVRVLQESSALFARATTPTSLVEGLAAIAQQAFSAALTAVLLRDDRGHLVLAAGEHPLENTLLYAGATPEWDALGAGEIVVITSLDDADAKYPGLGASLHAARITSLTAMPILDDGESLGVLVCFWRRDGIIADPLLTFQQALTHQVGHALRRISLEEQQRRERVDADQLWLKMQRLSAELRTETMPRVMVHLVAQGLGRTLEVDRVDVSVLAQGDIPRIDLRWTPDSVAEAPHTDDDEVHSRASTLWSVHSGLHLMNDSQSDTTLGASTNTIDADDGTRDIVLPLGEADQVIGMLTVGSSDDARTWTPIERAMVQGIATELAHYLLQASLLLAQAETVRRLRELDQEKSDLLATVNHELRTPLAAITGYTDLLSEHIASQCDSRSRGMIEIVQRNADRLEVLIARMMTVATPDAESFGDEHLDTVDLADALRSVAQSLMPIAAVREVSIDIDAPEALHVTTNAAGLEQVLVNVVQNAVKFSWPSGAVAIAAERVGGREGMPRVAVTVTDSGIGISEADMSRVGTRLFRGANAIESATPGTGLGLSIAKKILGSCGGDLSIRSRLGEGMTVEITLPSA